MSKPILIKIPIIDFENKGKIMKIIKKLNEEKLQFYNNKYNTENINFLKKKKSQ